MKQVSEPLDDSSTKFFCDPISVSSFLEQLISQDYHDTYRKAFGCDLHGLPDVFLHGQVAFTTFTPVPFFPDGGMTQDFLEACFVARTGLMLKTN